MNCQYCGKKIGILENWRYGRFCSKEHQTEFQEESGRLTASALSHARVDGAAANEAGQIVTLQSGSRPATHGEPTPPPDPPLMETVAQAQPTAVRCAPPEPGPAPPPAGERDQRCLKLLASIDRMPPVLEKDSRRRLVLEDAPYRFGTVVAKGERRILVPPSGAVQRRPKLVLAETLLPLRYDETGGPMPEFEPAWQSEAAWGSGESLPSAMEFGGYLEDYTPDQPWQDWDWDALLEEAKYFQTLTEQREKQRDQLRSHKAQERESERPASPHAPASGHPSMPGRASASRTPTPISAPAPNLAPAGPSGLPGTRSGRPAAPSQTASHTSGPGGILVPSMPSYSGMTVLRPVPSGSPQVGGAHRSVRLSTSSHVAAGGPARMESGGIEWVELAPPPFMALCKIDDPAPVCLDWRAAGPPIHPLDSAAPPVAPRNGTAGRAVCFVQQGALQFDPESTPPPIAPRVLTMDVLAGSLPAAPFLSIPLRLFKRPPLALPPRPARRPIALDLRPLPTIERPHLISRIAG